MKFITPTCKKQVVSVGSNKCGCKWVNNHQCVLSLPATHSHTFNCNKEYLTAFTYMAIVS